MYLDFVNDIKFDLIKKEIENLEVSRFFYNFICKLSCFKVRFIFLCKLVDFFFVLCFGVVVSNFGLLDWGIVVSGVFKVLNIELYCLEK